MIRDSSGSTPDPIPGTGSRVCGNCVHYPVREKDGRTCTMTGETVSPYGVTCFWFAPRLKAVEAEEEEAS